MAPPFPPARAAVGSTTAGLPGFLGVPLVACAPYGAVDAPVDDEDYDLLEGVGDKDSFLAALKDRADLPVGENVSQGDLDHLTDVLEKYAARVSAPAGDEQKLEYFSEQGFVKNNEKEKTLGSIPKPTDEERSNMRKAIALDEDKEGMYQGLAGNIPDWQTDNPDDVTEWNSWGNIFSWLTRTSKARSGLYKEKWKSAGLAWQLNLVQKQREKVMREAVTYAAKRAAGGQVASVTSEYLTARVVAAEKELAETKDRLTKMTTVATIAMKTLMAVDEWFRQGSTMFGFMGDRSPDDPRAIDMVEADEETFQRKMQQMTQKVDEEYAELQRLARAMPQPEDADSPTDEEKEAMQLALDKRKKQRVRFENAVEQRGKLLVGRTLRTDLGSVTHDKLSDQLENFFHNMKGTTLYSKWWRADGQDANGTRIPSLRRRFIVQARKEANLKETKKFKKALEGKKFDDLRSELYNVKEDKVTEDTKRDSFEEYKRRFEVEDQKRRATLGMLTSEKLAVLKSVKSNSLANAQEAVQKRREKQALIEIKRMQEIERLKAEEEGLPLASAPSAEPL